MKSNWNFCSISTNGNLLNLLFQKPETKNRIISFNDKPIGELTKEELVDAFYVTSLKLEEVFNQPRMTEHNKMVLKQYIEDKNKEIENRLRKQRWWNKILQHLVEKI